MHTGTRLTCCYGSAGFEVPVAEWSLGKTEDGSLMFELRIWGRVHGAIPYCTNLKIERGNLICCF